MSVESEFANTGPTPWRDRLEARVIAAVGVLVAAALATLLVGITRSVTAGSIDRAAADLGAARVAFDHLVDDRIASASSQASLVTALPVFRAHLTDSQLASDSATLEVLAEEYRHELNADFAIISGREGGWLASGGWPDGAERERLAAELHQASSGAPSRSLLPFGTRLFLVVSEPARFADEVLGAFTVGYALSDPVARRLADETHCDVTFVVGTSVYASSLAWPERGVLAQQLAEGRWRGIQASATQMSVGAHRYVAGQFPLTATSHVADDAHLLLLQDWAPAATFIGSVQREMLVVGVIVLAIALGCGVAASRHVTRPLRELVHAARDVAAGNWTRQIAVHGRDEIAGMASTFNAMTTSLRHWYDEAKRRDDELRQAQKLEAIGRLAGGVAHDFNNLLTAIRGYAEFLVTTLDEGDERRRDAIEIVNASDRAAGLTRQLLAFSRRQVVTPKVIALDRVVAGAEKLLRRLIGEDVRLSVHIANDPWPIFADITQVEQVLINLAVNARDAMPNGGTLRIEVNNVIFDRATMSHPAKLTSGRYIRLSVSDSGSGMEEETLSRIFEPFFTTKNESAGTGLGLATVYGIVDQAGGAIDVESIVGKGTTFHVYMPEAPESAIGVQEPAAPTPTTERASATVLVVEDDADVGRFVADALGKAGYKVLQASDPFRAMAIVKDYEAPIDLLLTDVVLPGMNGRELSNRVAAVRAETRILFMSGYPDDAVLRRGIERENVRFLQKPFSIDELRARTREALAASEGAVSAPPEAISRR